VIATWVITSLEWGWPGICNHSLVQGGKGSMSRIERDRMRLAILEEASIVCSTLSFAGSPMLYRLSRKYVPGLIL
jgi:senataxin